MKTRKTPLGEVIDQEFVYVKLISYTKTNNKYSTLFKNISSQDGTLTLLVSEDVQKELKHNQLYCLKIDLEKFEVIFAAKVNNGLEQCDKCGDFTEFMPEFDDETGEVVNPCFCLNCK